MSRAGEINKIVNRHVTVEWISSHPMARLIAEQAAEIFAKNDMIENPNREPQQMINTLDDGEIVELRVFFEKEH